VIALDFLVLFGSFISFAVREVYFTAPLTYTGFGEPFCHFWLVALRAFLDNWITGFGCGKDKILRRRKILRRKILRLYGDGDLDFRMGLAEVYHEVE